MPMSKLHLGLDVHKDLFARARSSTPAGLLAARNPSHALPSARVPCHAEAGAGCAQSTGRVKEGGQGSGEICSVGELVAQLMDRGTSRTAAGSPRRRPFGFTKTSRLRSRCERGTARGPSGWERGTSRPAAASVREGAALSRAQPRGWGAGTASPLNPHSVHSIHSCLPSRSSA